MAKVTTTDEPDKPKQKRGRRGEGTVFWDKKKKLYRAEVSLGQTPAGQRIRPKGYGRTMAEAREDLKEKLRNYDDGIETSDKYTVTQAVNDYIESKTGTVDPETVKRLRSYADNHVIPGLGVAKVKGRNALTADDIEDWLKSKADSLSTRMLESCLSLLRRSLTHAKRRKKARENVADQDIRVPKGRPGRKRNAAKLEHARALMLAAANETHGAWIEPYLWLSILNGPRTEEIRRLEWSNVFLATTKVASGAELPPHVRWLQSVRANDEMKTATSYRSVALAAPVVESLTRWKARQVENRRKSKHKHDGIRLVFGTRFDTVMTKDNVRRRLYALCDKAEVPRMSPAETRNTFVSIASALGGTEELIADICGHATTSTTRRVYRDELRPVITDGVAEMTKWFASGEV